MARLPIATENNQLIDYKQGTDSEVWVSPTTLTKANPVLTSIGLTFYGLDLTGTTPLLQSGLAAGTPLPITERIAHGYRIKTADGQVFTVDASREPIDSATSTRFIPVGSTTIPIFRPNATALTFGAVTPTTTTATYSNFLSFYSVAEGGFKGEGDEVSYRNIGASPFEVSRKVKIKSTFETSGYVTPGDTILSLIKRLVSSTTESIAILYVDPADQAVSFVADVKSDDRSFKVDEGYMAKFSFSVTTEPRFIDLTPS